MNIQNADGSPLRTTYKLVILLDCMIPSALAARQGSSTVTVPAHDPFGGQPQQTAVHMPPQVSIGNDADKDAFLHNADTAEPLCLS